MKVLDRRLSRIPQPWRTIVDWLATIALAVVFVLAFQAEVAKPYRIPSSSMEPTLHCAKPGAFCAGRFDDRVIANRLAYKFSDPERGQIVVFTAPKAADRCGAREGGSTFVKRIVGLPGELVSERGGVIYINGARLVEPYVQPSRRGPAYGERCPAEASSAR
jgi:signal peptidase I